MENASKALIIAGSVLIALVVISLLVIFYDDITEKMNAREKIDVTEQVAEFNKQYDVYYYKDIIPGNDMLSLANKVNDYNKRESEQEGYLKLDMTVTFTSKIAIKKDGDDLTTVIYKNQELNSEDLQNLIENKIDGWNCIISNMETSTKIKGYTIQYLSGLRNTELEEIFKEEISKKARYIEQEVQPKINQYLSYKSALTTLKNKKFKITEYKYDNKTGRVVLIKFKEI